MGDVEYRTTRRTVLRGASAGLLTLVGAGFLDCQVNQGVLTPSESAGSQPTLDTSGTFVDSYAGSPTLFNPVVATGGPNGRAIALFMGAGLVQLDWDDKTIKPYLAQSWEYTDPRTLVFHLRPDAKWSDGHEMTAEDVEFTFRLLNDKRVGGAPKRGIFRAVTGAKAYFDGAGSVPAIDGVSIIDKQTLKILFDRPDAAFLTNLAQTIPGRIPEVLPKHALSDIAPADFAKAPWGTDPSTRPVFSGPFKFVRYITDQVVEFERNDNFILGKPKAQKWLVRIGTSDNLLAAFERQEVDFVTVPVSEVDRIKALPHATVLQNRGGNTQLMFIQHARPFFKDKRIRQAMWYALDRQAMNKALYNGTATLWNGAVNPGHWAADPSIAAYNYDPAKAKQLLAAAGWDPNQKVTLRYPTGKPRELSAPLVQQYLAAVGMKVELAISDFATLATDWGSGNFDLMLIGGWDCIPEPDVSLYLLHSSQTQGSGIYKLNYVNSRMDQLLDQGYSTVDQAARARVYQQVDSLANDDVPLIWLYQEPDIVAFNKNVSGVRAPGLTSMTLGFPRIAHEVSGLKR